MEHTFRNLGEALDAGYSPVNHGCDRDVSHRSVAGAQGYDYESPDGETTVSVWFTDERNRAGSLGCFRSMFPPARS